MLKWFVLALAVGVTFGPYYCYDNPAASLSGLKEQFGIPEDLVSVTNATKLLEVEEFNTRYAQLYSLTCFPNILLSPVCGVLVDVFGCSKVTITCALVVVIGQLLFVYGTSFNGWPLMLIGRVIFGVGMEWLYVAQTALLAFWFDDAYISLALSIFGAGTKVGSLTAVLTGSALGRPVTAFGFGLAICVGSLVCAVVVSLLHEQKLRRDEKAAAVSQEAQPPISRRLYNVWLEVFEMPLGFWTMCIVSCFGFTSVWSLSNIGPAYLTHYNQSHGLQPDSPYIVNLKFASMCATIALVSPLAGRVVDASKQYFIIIFLGMVVAGGVLSCAALDVPGLSDPLLLMVVSAIGLAFYTSAVWPTVPLLVSPSAHGTAYGLLVSFQNLGLSLGADAVSAMQPPRCGNSYECSLFTLAGCAGVAAVVGLITKVIADRGTRNSTKRD